MRDSGRVSVDSPNLDSLDRWAFDVRRVDKPWGYELIWAQTGKYAGKLLHVNAGHSLSLQFHREKDESWLVQSGREAADAPVFEEYLNSPKDTAPADLVTEICLPLA